VGGTGNGEREEQHCYRGFLGCQEPAEPAPLRRASSFQGHSDFPLTSQQKIHFSLKIDRIAHL